VLERDPLGCVKLHCAPGLYATADPPRLGPTFRFAAAIDLIPVTLLTSAVARLNALTNARRLANFKISKLAQGRTVAPRSAFRRRKDL
jgi:hypothetical protein